MVICGHYQHLNTFSSRDTLCHPLSESIIYKEYITGQPIIRLHDPDRSGIEKIPGENWNKNYINRDEELKDIVEMIKDLNNRGVDVYLNVNNC